MRRRFRFLFCILGVLLLGACAKAAPETEVTVLRIGKADAIIVISGGHAALIDAGEEDDAEEILKKLAKKGVSKLDMLIVTHYDKDHVGGAADVLSGISVGAVYDADYEGSGDAYRRYAEAIEDASIPRHRVTERTEVALGDARFVLTPSPLAPDAPEENDRSLTASLLDGYAAFYFAADAEEALIDALLAEGVAPHAVLKMPHHGRIKQNMAAFLDAVAPQIALITDSDKNPADEQTLSLLRERGIELYQTKDGDIAIHSTQKGVEVTQK